MHPVLPCRGNLFLLTYLLFPVNVLIGVLLGLWRMIITALFNIVHMGRMDISLLNRNVEPFDPGEPDILQPIHLTTLSGSLLSDLKIFINITNIVTRWSFTWTLVLDPS